MNGLNFISCHKTLCIGYCSFEWVFWNCYSVLFWRHKWTSLSVSLTARLRVCERNAVLDFLKRWPKGRTNECGGVSWDLIGYWSTDVFGWWDGGIMSCVSVIMALSKSLVLFHWHNSFQSQKAMINQNNAEWLMLVLQCWIYEFNFVPCLKMYDCKYENKNIRVKRDIGNLRCALKGQFTQK